MALDDFGGSTLIISAALIVVGWYVTHKSNQRHEVFKLRLQKRMALFEKAFLALSSIADAVNQGKTPEDWTQPIEKLVAARMEINLYGFDDEVRAFEEMIKALEARDNENFVRRHTECVRLMKTNLRRELRY